MSEDVELPGVLSEAPGLVGAIAVNHIGIAVRSINDQRDFYETVLGARFEGMEEVGEQGVRVAFFAVGEGSHAVRIELLESTRPESPIAKFIDKRGEGLHHVAYTVRDLGQRLAELRAGGVALVDQSPRVGAHGTRVAFLHPKASHGVLTELCERVRDALT